MNAAASKELLARSVKPAVTADTCARSAALPRPRAPESGERRPRVLLTDAQDRSSLAACRSLHRAGYAVDAVASSRPAAAHWSRFCDRRLVAIDPREDEARFVEELREIACTASYDLLVTGSDASLLAVSRHRGRLKDLMELGLPPAEVVERCVSKQALADAAVEAGLGTPETEVCADETEAKAAARRFGYPVVLKPPSTVLARNGGAVQRGSAVLRDEASLEVLWPKYGARSLFQRRLDGDVVSFSGVAADPGFESSVPGLHFVGAAGTLTFGPVMRFVVGTWYAAPALARNILGRRQQMVRLSYKPRVALRPTADLT